MKKRIVVVGAVILRQGKIFATQRGENMSLAGMWEFPGGKIEAGETPEGALAREIEEELGCEVTVGTHLTTTDHEYDFGVVSLSTYWCELRGGTPTISEHSASAWLTVQQLDDFEWAPADIPAVELIRQELS